MHQISKGHCASNDNLAPTPHVFDLEEEGLEKTTNNNEKDKSNYDSCKVRKSRHFFTIFEYKTEKRRKESGRSLRDRGVASQLL